MEPIKIPPPVPSLTTEQQFMLEVFKGEINSCNDITLFRKLLYDSTVQNMFLRNTVKTLLKGE